MDETQRDIYNRFGERDLIFDPRKVRSTYHIAILPLPTHTRAGRDQVDLRRGSEVRLLVRGGVRTHSARGGPGQSHLDRHPRYLSAVHRGAGTLHCHTVMHTYIHTLCTVCRSSSR